MANVSIVIPTYKGVAPEAHNFLVEMLRASNCTCGTHEPWNCPFGKHHVKLVPSPFGGSVVHWTRNQVIAKALYAKREPGIPKDDFLLLMDDDMTAEPGYLCRLVSQRLDIVAGICTVRRDPPRPNIRYWNPDKATFEVVTQWDWTSQKAFPIDGVGAAFMLVRREVLERMGQAHLDCFYERLEDKRKFPNSVQEIDQYWDVRSAKRHERFELAQAHGIVESTDCWWFQFLDNIHEEQFGECGEDLSFCWKAKALGYKIYADPQVKPGHLGVYAYGVEDYRDRCVDALAEIGETPQGMTYGRTRLFEPELVKAEAVA